MFAKRLDTKMQSKKSTNKIDEKKKTSFNDIIKVELGLGQDREKRLNTNAQK